MNRQIKFRAWDSTKEKMVSWEQITHNSNLDLWGGYFDLFNREELQPMQYTGLNDKNGKEIYEGDIVIQEIWNGEDNIDGESVTDEFEGIVIYDRNGYGIQTEICDGKRTEVPIYEIDEFVTTEIIGNIYENKELLT